MSGSPASATPAPTGSGAAADPSMEDILASIRRILSEDETAPVPATATPAQAPPVDDVLVLDPAMLVPRDEAPPVAQAPSAEPQLMTTVPATVMPPLGASLGASLVAPEAAAAAASSVDSLVRTLSTERSMLVSNHGPTIEDIVRQEIRPLLKTWLDVNLPPMVERLVRIEIERVVGRVAP